METSPDKIPLEHGNEREQGRHRAAACAARAAAWFSRLVLLFLKVSAPFFLAAAWSQVFNAVLALAVPVEEAVGTWAAVGYNVLYAAVLYLMAGAGLLALSTPQGSSSTATEVFLAFFGHVVGFSFRDIAQAVLLVFVPCSLSYPYTLFNYVLSPFLMVALSFLRRGFRPAVAEGLADIDLDAFGMLCGWALNNSFHVTILGGSSEGSITATMWIGYTLMVTLIGTWFIVRQDVIQINSIRNALQRKLVTLWMDLSFHALALTLGWTTLYMADSFIATIVADIPNPTLRSVTLALLVSVVAMGMLSLNNNRHSARAETLRDGLEDFVRAQPHVSWPPVIPDWDRRAAAPLNLKEVSELLTEDGSFVVCNFKRWFCVSTPFLFVKFARDARPSPYWYFKRLATITHFYRRWRLLYLDPYIVQHGIMRERHGKWVGVGLLTHLRRAAMRAVSWGFVIGFSWEEATNSAISKALGLAAEEEKFLYCTDSVSEGELPAPAEGSARRRLLQENEGDSGEVVPGGEDGEGEGSLGQGWALLAKLGFALLATVLFCPLLWWIYEHEEEEEEEEVEGTGKGGGGEQAAADGDHGEKAGIGDLEEVGIMKGMVAESGTSLSIADGRV